MSGAQRGRAASPSAGDRSRSLGNPRVHLRRTASTNELARELAIAGAPHGTLVTAAEQTAGRGRQGRRWWAPPGSALLMSLLLRSPPALLPLSAALAVCDAAGEQARIKWPNDVVVAASPASSPRPGLAKLAGILIEGRLQEGWAVLGIGLNVAVRVQDLPAELRAGAAPAEHPADAGSASGLPAATLGLTPADVEPTLALLLDRLARRLAQPAQATLAGWRARDALRGREIAWASGRGRADGIDGAGRLVVCLPDGGRTALGAGEVHLREVG
ncbi:MAG TPA: biotin--[acetyl-CoA-carboxylase] ligase [Solirubrobacteraceae bacterium]|nr:biotin--[acetyl-CoA-carboxylase] ligase [Solirubrobacteraceae bacterium]